MSLERINRKLAIIQALLIDIAEDVASLVRGGGEEKPLIEKRVRKRLEEGERLEIS